MVIMGIDHSLTSTGIVIIDGDTLLHSEAISTVKDTGEILDTIRRVRQIAHRIKTIAEQFNVTHFAMEELAYNAKGNATRDVAVLFGAIVACIGQCSVTPPTALKKFATGYGLADKKQMVAAVANKHAAMHQLLINTQVCQGRYDLADAFWLCQKEKENPMQIRTALSVTMTEEDLKQAVVEYVQRNSPYPTLIVDDIVFQSKRNPTRVEVDVTAHNDDGTTAVAVKAEPTVADAVVDAVTKEAASTATTDVAEQTVNSDLLDELLSGSDPEPQAEPEKIAEDAKPAEKTTGNDDLASLLTL